MGKRVKKPRKEKQSRRDLKAHTSIASTRNFREFEASTKTRLKAIRNLTDWMRNRLERFVKKFATKEKPVLILQSNDGKTGKMSPHQHFDQPVAVIGFGDIVSIRSTVAVLLMNVNVTEGLIETPVLWDMYDTGSVKTDRTRHADTNVKRVWNDSSGPLIMTGSIVYESGYIVVGDNVKFQNIELDVTRVVFDSSTTGIHFYNT
jgi:hypothetical protein